MSEHEFIERVSEILNRPLEGFTFDSALHQEAAFDSVAILSLIVLLDELGKSVPGARIKSCRTLGELWALAQ